MTQHLVGIAEFKLSESGDDIIVAPNLGSCLGVAVYDPKRKVGGMVHCLLPLSSADAEKAKERPCLYVDTGVAFLLNLFLQAGSSKKDLVVAVAGGASINDQNGIFEIGKRNHTVLRKILWKNGVLIKAEHVGEDSSRTISLHVDSGNVTLKFKGETIQLV